MTVSRTVMVTAAMLAFGGAAMAQSGSASKWVLDPNAPLDLHYDGEGRLLNPQTCTTVVQGAVEVTQDRIRLRSNTLTAYHARRNGQCDTINRLEAQGNVYYVTPLEAVRADKAVYDMTADRITFTGAVIITQGENVASTDNATIDLKTNEISLKGRTRTIFYPKRTPQ